MAIRTRAIRYGCVPQNPGRAPTRFTAQPQLARLDKDDVWINAADAGTRGIEDGDRVRIFNERGTTVLPAHVTDRIAPGVVSIKEGAWFTPDSDGTDQRGCANVLSDDRSAPCGATTYNSNQVEIARLEEIPGIASAIATTD